MLNLHFQGNFKVKVFLPEKLGYIYNHKKILKNT